MIHLDEQDKHANVCDEEEEEEDGQSRINRGKERGRAEWTYGPGVSPIGDVHVLQAAGDRWRSSR